MRNTLARNFRGLKLSIKFLFENSTFKWLYPDFTPHEISIYSPFLSCKNRTQIDFLMTCQKVSCQGSVYILSSLTMMFPLDENVNFSVVGTNKNPTFAIEVKGQFINFKVLVCEFLN